MTAQYLSFVYFIILSTFIFGIIQIHDLNAQSNSTPLEVTTTTSTFSSSTTELPTTSSSEPWFEIEKLTGDRINQGDFVVGPGRIEKDVKPGQTFVEYISVSNRISDNRTFELTVEDIAGSDETDEAVVLLGEEKGPYTIKDYISFPEKTFSLKLGERARIPVTITIPPDAEPGGFYGSVLVSTVQTDDSENRDSATPRSPIIARVGTLFFLTIPGDINKEGETKEISLPNKKWWYEKGPIELNILYQNTGSVHLNPYGELRVKNLFNEEVGFMEIEPWFALPQSFRTRNITWDREVLFGRYTVTAYINRGYDNIVDEVSVSFWVLPWKVLGGTFLIVFFVIFGIRTFLKRFEFKRRE